MLDEKTSSSQDTNGDTIENPTYPSGHWKKEGWWEGYGIRQSRNFGLCDNRVERPVVVLQILFSSVSHLRINDFLVYLNIYLMHLRILGQVYLSR